MAFYTGPLYHLKGGPENVENHNKMLDNRRDLGRDSPLNDPEPSIRVRPEMFRKIHTIRALFWALELTEEIFSPYKQALSERMRWPAVPPFININQRLRERG